MPRRMGMFVCGNLLIFRYIDKQEFLSRVDHRQFEKERTQRERERIQRENERRQNRR